MRAVILAAGQGRRLRPLTDSRPKCLVEVRGRSLLDRQIDVLRSRGIHDILVVGGHRADQLPSERAVIAINHRYAETNMLWTLFTAEARLKAPLLIAYGDIIYSARVLDRILDSSGDISVVVDSEWIAYWKERSEDPLYDAETLRYRSDGSLAEIGGRPQDLNEIQGQYIGLMKFNQNGLVALRRHYHKAQVQPDLLSRGPEQAYMTDILQSLINHGTVVSAVTVQGQWAEIDTLADIPIAEQRLMDFYHG